MENTEGRHMDERERTLIAMGAAMGAGCRKCAEGLQGIGKTIGIPARDTWKAFEMGLNAKAEAINTMRAAVSALRQKAAERGEECGCEKPDESGSKKAGKIACLIRLASYVAANSAQDVRSEIDEAVAKGADRREINLCMSIARMVREKAAGFSDKEIGETGEEPESDTRGAGGEAADTTCNAGCSCGCK